MRSVSLTAAALSEDITYEFIRRSLVKGLTINGMNLTTELPAEMPIGKEQFDSYVLLVTLALKSEWDMKLPDERPKTFKKLLWDQIVLQKQRVLIHIQFASVLRLFLFPGNPYGTR